jgi:transposase
MHRLFVGLDVSLEMTSICVIDEDGAMVLEAKAASEPEAICETLRGLDGKFDRVGLEAGPLSSWLASGLKAAGLPAICIEARHAKAAMVAMTRNTEADARTVRWTVRPPNDRNDARSLAHLIRSGWFKAVHVKSVESQELRTLLIAREFFVNKLRDHENEIRGLLRPFGLKVGRVGARDFEVRIRELTAGVPRLRLCMEALLAGRSEMFRQLAELHRELLRVTANDELCRRFMTIPGVGPVTALAFKCDPAWKSDPAMECAPKAGQIE